MFFLLSGSSSTHLVLSGESGSHISRSSFIFGRQAGAEVLQRHLDLLRLRRGWPPSRSPRRCLLASLRMSKSSMKPSGSLVSSLTLPLAHSARFSANSSRSLRFFFSSSFNSSPGFFGSRSNLAACCDLVLDGLVQVLDEIGDDLEDGLVLGLSLVASRRSASRACSLRCNRASSCSSSSMILILHRDRFAAQGGSFAEIG